MHTAKFSATGLKIQGPAKNTMLHCFSYFKERKDFIEVLIKSGLIYIFYDKLSCYLFNFLESIGGNNLPHNNYLTRYASGGLYSILIEWINNDTKESVEEIAKLIAEINI